MHKFCMVHKSVCGPNWSTTIVGSEVGVTILCGNKSRNETLKGCIGK